MTNVSDVPRFESCEAIARLIHATAIAAHQQHPDLLTESGIVWLKSIPTEAQPTQIVTRLSSHRDQAGLLRAVDVLLNQIFTPAFQATKAHRQVRQRVQQLVIPAASQSMTTPTVTSAQDGAAALPPDPLPQGHLSIQAEMKPGVNQGESPAAPTPSTAPREERPSSPASPVAASVTPQAPLSGLLLVDAENMHPSPSLEAYLQSLAQYPLRYRLAFGNWRTLGNRDQEFYRRGYQMIHVPSGKNSADIKMSLDASLISLHHPSIQEVFICSADSDLLHLGYVLLRQGMTPYQVSHDQQGFKVFNLATQTQQRVSLPTNTLANSGSEVATTPPSSPDPTPRLPSSLTQMKSWLRILILQEQQAHPGQPVTISRLGALFRERNHISANQVLQTYGDYTTLKQLLESDDSFVLTPLDATSVQVALQPTTTVTAAPPPPPSFSGPITNVQDLEQAVLVVLTGLMAQPGGTVPLTALGSTFAQVYQQPMSQVLQRLGEPKGLPKFLAKCSSIRLERKSENWHVGLAIPR